jgi:hypothetical protein
MLQIALTLGCAGLFLSLFEKILPLKTHFLGILSYFVLALAVILFLYYMMQNNMI